MSRVFGGFLVVMIIIAMLGSITNRDIGNDISQHGIKGALDCLWGGPDFCDPEPQPEPEPEPEPAKKY